LYERCTYFREIGCGFNDGAYAVAACPPGLGAFPLFLVVTNIRQLGELLAGNIVSLHALPPAEMYAE
jgi:hypothetical protein